MADPSPFYIATISGMDVESQARFYVIPARRSWWRRLLRRFGR